MEYKYKIVDYNSLDFRGFSLKPIRQDEIFTIMKWRNNQIEYLRQTKPLTKEKQSKYFKHYILGQCDTEKPVDILFAYYHEESLVGYGGLTHIDWYNKIAEISFVLGVESTDGQEVYCNYLLSFIELLKIVAFEQLMLLQIFSVTYFNRRKQIECLHIIMEKVTISELPSLNRVEKYPEFIIHRLIPGGILK